MIRRIFFEPQESENRSFLAQAALEHSPFEPFSLRYSNCMRSQISDLLAVSSTFLPAIQKSGVSGREAFSISALVISSPQSSVMICVTDSLSEDCPSAEMLSSSCGHPESLLDTFVSNLVINFYY